MSEKNVLEKIVSSKKLPVLFIGLGISKRYLYKYPNWEELLEICFKQFTDDNYVYESIIDRLNREGLDRFRKNQELASFAENEFNKAFFEHKIKIGKSNNPSWVNKGISPFKMFICHYFKRLPVNRDEKLKDEINELKKLRNKISAIITTNYDCFLEEKIFNSEYTVFTSQNQLFNSNSYNIAEIYKIHGSVKDANSIVITKKDYEYFNDSRKLFIAKMLTLFAESPIIFIGYSLTDKNIQSIIIDFISCLSDTDIKNIDEHFVFINFEKGQNELVESKTVFLTSDNKSIPVTQITTDNYLEVFKILNKITPSLSPAKIRAAKRIIKNIVDESITSDNASAVIVGIDKLDELELSSEPMAIAIGERMRLSKSGYSLIPVSEIIEDILFDDKNFDINYICTTRLPAFSYKELVPMCKYIKQFNQNIDDYPKLQKNFNNWNSISKILSSSIIRQLKNYEEFKDVDTTLSEYIGKHENYTYKFKYILKNWEILSNQDLRSMLIELYNSNSKECIASTYFKRCVMILDYRENWQKKN